MYTAPVIDAHLHLTEDGQWFGDDRYRASLDILLEQMEAVGIDKGLILSLASLDQNAYIGSVCEKSGGRLFALAGIDPLRHDVSSLAPFMESDIFKGVKLHPRRENFSPLDERVFPLYEKAQSSGWPLNFDAFGHSATLPMDELRPAVFDRLAKKFPDLVMVLSHCGAPWVMEAFFTAKSNSNVYLDCSFIMERYRDSSIHTDLLYTAKHLDRKLIYGSDFPEEPVNRYMSLARIELNDLPEEKRTNIFGQNAMRVYGIR